MIIISTSEETEIKSGRNVIKKDGAEYFDIFENHLK